MKTVMKKMFCLLMVAVLLVSAVPTAFAEGEYPAEIQCEEHNKPANRLEAYDVAATCTTEGKIAYFCEPGIEGVSSHKVWYSRAVPKLGHAPGDEATCTTAQICTRCNETLVSALTHNWLDATCSAPKSCSRCDAIEGAQLDHQFADATCTEPQKCTRKDCTATNGTALGHTYGSDTVCDVCKYCNACGKTITDNDAKNHDTKCQYHPEFNKECDKCGTEYTALETHPTCETCNNVNAKAGNPCHATANCPYCKVCLKNGDFVKLHKTADHCETCGNTDGTHKQGFDCYKSTGNATVHVHVRLHTSNVLTKTVELLTYKDSSDARIYSSVAKHDDLIRAELKKQYPGYSWSGNLYDDPKELEDTKETIGKGTTVYINAYTDQDLIYIYVHNSRSMSNQRIIQLEGKKVGETVTKTEVTNAVKKYFSVNSLSMYSEQAWEDYVDGDSVESVSSLKVTSDPYFIDVKISGSAKSSSGSGSTADSTNPKTGDEIFAPAMVLGLSASALVVLYFLNKKRAF